MGRSTKRLAWLAGLLEGEGSFGFYNSPRVSLKMTDLDVVKDAHQLMGATTKLACQKKVHTQDIYVFSVHSSLAIGWMMTLYPMLGKRRRAKIAEVLKKWKTMPGYQRGTCKHNITSFIKCTPCWNQRRREAVYKHHHKGGAV